MNIDWLIEHYVKCKKWEQNPILKDLAKEMLMEIKSIAYFHEIGDKNRMVKELAKYLSKYALVKVFLSC